MNDYDALLATVLAKPEDDLPRLVFADWMEESGQPALIARAHFIRAQIEAENHPLGTPERDRLDALANRLYLMCSHEWAYELPGWLAQDRDRIDDDRLPQPKPYGYRRGFVADVELSLADLWTRGHQIFEVAPVQTVRVSGFHAEFPIPPVIFGMLFYLNQITTLQLEYLAPHLFADIELGPQDIEEPSLFLDLMSAFTLRKVRCLILNNLDLTDLWLQQFARRLPESAFAASLTELNLAHNQLTDASAWFILTSQAFQSITQLNVAANRLGSDARRFLRTRFGDGLIDE